MHTFQSKTHTRWRKCSLNRILYYFTLFFWLTVAASRDRPSGCDYIVAGKDWRVQPLIRQRQPANDDHKNSEEKESMSGILKALLVFKRFGAAKSMRRVSESHSPPSAITKTRRVWRNMAGLNATRIINEGLVALTLALLLAFPFIARH